MELVALAHACSLLPTLTPDAVVTQHRFVTELATRRATPDAPVVGSRRREYHTASHVAAVWAYLWPRSSRLADCRAALAAFAVTHDWFWLAGPEFPGHSEALSRGALLSMNRLIGLDANQLALAAIGVEASAHHAELLRGLPPEVELMMDADLHQLAAPWPAYAENSRRVRAEMGLSWGDPLWTSGRRAFLESVARRDRLFYSLEARSWLEDRARKNVEDELALLALGLPVGEDASSDHVG